MKIAREDLLKAREVAAVNGTELTVDEVVQLLKIARPNLEIVNTPGLVTWLKNHGNNSTSGSSIGPETPQ